MAFTPLRLHILRQGDTITMYLEEDARTVRERSYIQVAESLMVDLESRVATIINQANATATLQRTAATPLRSGMLANFHADFQAVGSQLFAQLFPEAIQQRLRGADLSDLVLYLDDQLVQIPWELAFDGHHFLLARFRIGRQVLADDRLKPGRPHTQVPTPLKMLIIADPTENLESAQLEGEQLQELLDFQPNLEVTFTGGRRLGRLDLLQALDTYDLVHYAGHAVFDVAQPDHSRWILYDGEVTAQELRRLQNPPLLVFANACQAGTTTSWTSNGQAFGIGSAFLLAGTQNYIGTFCVIPDTYSATFAADFYQHFLYGKSLGEALAAARELARQQEATSGLLWASYMHYGDPTFRLPTPTTAQYNEAPSPTHTPDAHPLAPPGEEQHATRPSLRPPRVRLPGSTAGHHDHVPAPDRTPEAQPLDPPGAGPHDVSPPPGPPWWKKPWAWALGGISLGCALFAFLWFRPPATDPYTSRPLTLALLPCQSDIDASVVDSRLEKLFYSNNRLKLVERTTLQKILDELHFSRSAEVDSQRALQVGKIHAARLMGFCRLRLPGLLSVRVFDTETSVIKAPETENFEYPEGLDDVVQKVVSSVLEQIRRHYPLQGRILRVTPQGLLINLGEEHGLTTGLMLDVFEATDPPASSKPIARVQVSDVLTAQLAQAQLLQSTMPVQHGMYIKEVRKP